MQDCQGGSRPDPWDAEKDLPSGIVYLHWRFDIEMIRKDGLGILVEGELPRSVEREFLEIISVIPQQEGCLIQTLLARRILLGIVFERGSWYGVKRLEVSPFYPHVSIQCCDSDE
jgi:hypothetical protein